MSTLTFGTTPITLPDDMLWLDEFAWQAVAQDTRYSITGALIVEAALRLKGRPISLQGAETYGWIDRATLLTLNTWKALAGQTFTLLLRGITYSVKFDQSRGAVTAVSVLDYSDPAGTDFYAATVNLIEV